MLLRAVRFCAVGAASVGVVRWPAAHSFTANLRLTLVDATHERYVYHFVCECAMRVFGQPPVVVESGGTWKFTLGSLSLSLCLTLSLGTFAVHPVGRLHGVDL